VSPTGQVNTSNPTIQAYVEDRWGSLLTKQDIDVYLDGKPMRFSYGRSSGRITCPAGSLSSGPHTVEIEAYIEDDGGGRTGRKRWTFNVRR